MSDGQAYALCDVCGERLVPADPAVIYGLVRRRSNAVRGARYEEGLGAYIHEACFLASPGHYRPKRKPEPRHDALLSHLLEALRAIGGRRHGMQIPRVQRGANRERATDAEVALHGR